MVGGKLIEDGISELGAAAPSLSELLEAEIHRNECICARLEAIGHAGDFYRAYILSDLKFSREVLERQDAGGMVRALLALKRNPE